MFIKRKKRICGILVTRVHQLLVQLSLPKIQDQNPMQTHVLIINLDPLDLLHRLGYGSTGHMEQVVNLSSACSSMAHCSMENSGLKVPQICIGYTLFSQKKKYWSFIKLERVRLDQLITCSTSLQCHRPTSQVKHFYRGDLGKRYPRGLNGNLCS